MSNVLPSEWLMSNMRSWSEGEKEEAIRSLIHFVDRDEIIHYYGDNIGNEDPAVWVITQLPSWGDLEKEKAIEGVIQFAPEDEIAYVYNEEING